MQCPTNWTEGDDCRRITPTPEDRPDVLNRGLQPSSLGSYECLDGDQDSVEGRLFG